VFSEFCNRFLSNLFLGYTTTSEPAPALPLNDKPCRPYQSKAFFPRTCCLGPFQVVATKSTQPIEVLLRQVAGEADSTSSMALDMTIALAIAMASCI
jgi:hypothetical protein